MSQAATTHPMFGIFFAMPRFIYAQAGMRRAFLSDRDAAAYERGVRAFEAGEPAPDLATPAGFGWRDARQLAGEAA